MLGRAGKAGGERIEIVDAGHLRTADVTHGLSRSVSPIGVVGIPSRGFVNVGHVAQQQDSIERVLARTVALVPGKSVAVSLIDRGDYIAGLSRTFMDPFQPGPFLEIDGLKIS